MVVGVGALMVGLVGLVVWGFATSMNSGSASNSSTSGPQVASGKGIAASGSTPVSSAGLVVPVPGNTSAPLRNGPGFGSQVLKQFPSGTRVVARRFQETPGKNTPDRWYEVALAADASVTGWMHGDVLQFQQEPANKPASVAAPQGRAAETTDLPPEDVGLVDTRRGWEWSDRCWRNLQAGNLRWARNECMMGMNLPADSPAPMSSLLYNLGLIEEREGAKARSAEYFKRSLALREHPEVRAALLRVE
ncbi:SH3 domain-containing protein [Chondromyces crocatus]|nr:SH3 domain-containing protein [Chondromyces crocatus]